MRGHTGVPGNERCDEIAVDFSKGRRPALFDGDLLHYSYAIHDLPPDQDLPTIRPIEAKPAAFSYLSLLGGEVYRHRTWAGCELRVKGRSGAKFKKALAQPTNPKIFSALGPRSENGPNSRRRADNKESLLDDDSII